MPKRDRGFGFNVVTAAFVVVVLILIGCAIWSASALKTASDVQAQHYATHYAENSQQKIAETCNTASPDFAKCVADIIEAAHEQQRSESDLAAQRQMAEWALAMVVVSGALGLLTFGLSGYAALLLRDTLAANRATANAALDANQLARSQRQRDQMDQWRSQRDAQASLMISRDANRIARESAERQLRAYVGITDVLVKKMVVGERYHIDVIFKNSGQTPARGLRVNVGGIGTPDLKSLKFREREPRSTGGSKLDLGAGFPHTVPLTGPYVMTPEAIEAMRQRTTFLVIGGYWSYRDVFGKHRRGVFRGYVSLSGDGKWHVTAAGKNNRTN